MDDREAISLLREGDISGLEVLVHRYQLRAMRAAFLVTNRQSLAEDIVASAFLRAYDRIHQFDTDRRFGPWFLRIVVNDALTAVTRMKRQVSLDQAEGDGRGTVGELVPDPGPGPQEMAERAELSRAVRLALSRLTPPQRAAVVMKYYLGLRESEVADRMGRTPGTIKRHLYNGRERLRAVLGKVVGTG